MTAAGLFAGIGGIEQGLATAGIETQLLCEIDAGARAVLKRQMPSATLYSDIRELQSLPKVDIVTAGFPCQDLSQAGCTAGIGGSRSGLVDHVFRLIGPGLGDPRWLVLENVPFMLQLDRGRAMRHLTTKLEDRGYAWAYRVVDARSFGLPQRRLRVVLVASRTEDPRPVLFAGDVTPPADLDANLHACGFYWTEGTRGLGWAVDAVPTLKGGSTIGIASPPAVRLPKAAGIVTPSIEDAERLQGFAAGWTEAAVEGAGARRGHRWKLIGNAVSVPLAAWLGSQLRTPGSYDATRDQALQPGDRWPIAAWGQGGIAHTAAVGSWPMQAPYHHLNEFLKAPSPLSPRATAGFLRRAENSSLRFVDGFLDDVRSHLGNVSDLQAA